MAVRELITSATQAIVTHTWVELTTWLLLISTVWYGVVLAYRLTLHPLAKYPGDLWWKLTDWPLVFACYRGDRHITVQSMHERYGTVVRTGPNTLSSNTSTALAAIHGNRDANVRRGDWYKTLDQSSGANSTQSVMDRSEHAFRRRVMLQAFSDKALREQEVFIDENVQRFVATLTADADEKIWSPARDYAVVTTWFGFDFVGDLGFGSSFDMLEREDNRYVWDMLRGTNIFLYFAGYLPFSPLLRPLLGTSIMDYLGGYASETLQFFRLSNQKLGEREALEETSKTTGQPPRRDIFHYLFNGRDPESGRSITHAELHADAGLLIAAGSDGTSMGMSALLFHLLQNPATLAQLVAELRSSVCRAADLRLPAINQLPYLHACLEEALRLSPPVPSAFPRRVLHGGLLVDGLWVPAGVDVGVPAYSIQRNGMYYAAPHEFRPERWMPHAEGIVAAKRAFCAFGLGSMNCIGKNVAYLAMKLATAKLLYAYDIRVPEDVGLVGGGDKGAEPGRQREREYQMIDWMIGYRTGPMVQFRKREVKE